MRALPITVYIPVKYSDCTNGGISSRYAELLCVCPDGWKEIDENDPPENLVHVVCRSICGRNTYHVEPVARPDEGNYGWMAGGNYAATCDSRFSTLIGNMYCAVSIHDRQETPAEYDMLSR